jgi:outer membrane protein, multidrug efflux system
MYESELPAAFQEAEDAIADYRLHQDRFAKLEEAAGRARAALALSEELYKVGLGDLLGVLDAEKSVLELELAVADSRASALVQSVFLYKALAGGCRYPSKEDCCAVRAMPRSIPEKTNWCKGYMEYQ